MTDREERQDVIEVLERLMQAYERNECITCEVTMDDEDYNALRYAVSSIKTDIKYDLLYEETSGQADKQADKPITKNCESCRYYGSHHKVCNYCYKCSLWTEQEPTESNILSSGTRKNSKKLESISTTKENLGVDTISRADVLKLMQDNWHTHNGDWAMQESMDDIRALPSVTPQEPKTGHCKNCKFFELNSWAACGGIPIIVAHEICKAWGKGCKTKEDGYCFLFEPQESEGKE